MHGVHEVGGERAVCRVAQAMARADPLQTMDAMAQDAPAADQIGPTQRQLRMARPEILDARENLVEVVRSRFWIVLKPNPAIIPLLTSKLL